MISPKSPLGLIAKGSNCLLDLYKAAVISSPERVTWFAELVREFVLPDRVETYVSPALVTV